MANTRFAYILANNFTPLSKALCLRRFYEIFCIELLNFLPVFSCFSHVNSIDKSWFKEQISIKNYHTEQYDRCVDRYNSTKNFLDEQKNELIAKYPDSFDTEAQLLLKIGFG